MLALLLLILGIQYTTLQSILGILGGILGIFGYFGDSFFGYIGIPLPPLADPAKLGEGSLQFSQQICEGAGKTKSMLITVNLFANTTC